MKAVKHYQGISRGRIAGVPRWNGGHYFTSDPREQMRIENHPLFVNGFIKVVDDNPPKHRSTTVDLTNAKWSELKALADDRGIPTFGKKKVDLIKELSEE